MGTHYDTLRVGETACDAEIVRAFRKAAMIWHPDRNPGNEQAASGMFKQASDARAVLLDPRQRADYDRHLAAARTPPSPPKPPPVRPQPSPASPPRSQGQPSPPARPAGPPTADRDVWMGIALAFAAQGADSAAVSAALVSRGCPSSDAEKFAQQAVDTQPKSSTSKQGLSAVPPTASQGSDASSKLFLTLGLLIVVGLVFTLTQLNPPRIAVPTTAVAASAAAIIMPVPTAPAKTWSAQLPVGVVRFDELSGQGKIRYASFPTSDEYAYFREKQSEVFSMQLLQTIPMPGGRQLLLFSSQPSDFECHACRPLLSAMLIKGGGDHLYTTILPLQILGTAGSFGNVSLKGDRRVNLLKIGPRREGFVFKDVDSGQGSVVEWGNLFSVERDRFRALGSFHVHEDSFNSGDCNEKKREVCAQKDTKIRFARGDTSGDYFEILASEVEVDSAKQPGSTTKRNYVLQFNGERYTEKVVHPEGQKPAASAPVSRDETTRSASTP